MTSNTAPPLPPPPPPTLTHPIPEKITVEGWAMFKAEDLWGTAE